MVTFSPLPFNFTWEYIISKVQQNHKGLKINGVYQLLDYVGC